MASAAAAEHVAPPRTRTAADADAAFAKIVWRKALAPAASGSPSDVLQQTFSSLQVRLADEAGGSEPASTGNPSGALAGLQSAALSAKSRKADPEPCSSDPASRKLAHDAPQCAGGAPTATVHDLPLCCSPTCASRLSRGCPEEHADPSWCADSDYDSATSSDVDGEDGEDDA